MVEDIAYQWKLAEGPRNEIQRALSDRTGLRPSNLIALGRHAIQRGIALVVVGAPKRQVGLRHCGGRLTAEIARLFGQPQPAEGRRHSLRHGLRIYRAHHSLPFPIASAAASATRVQAHRTNDKADGSLARVPPLYLHYIRMGTGSVAQRPERVGTSIHQPAQRAW